MNMIKLFLAASLGMSLAACGGGGSSVNVPGAPTGVRVAAGTTVGTTASVSFTAPASNGGGTISGYTVTAIPSGNAASSVAATGMASPITVTGLTAQTAYTYTVVATNSAGRSAAATTGSLNFYGIVETFTEPSPMLLASHDSIFTGTFTYDSTNHTVSNLTGSLTQAMTMMDPMTTVTLNNQLSSVPDATLGGLLVTTFALNTTNTFDGGGFAPGGTRYFGLSTGATNPFVGGVGNAYAMIFVNTTDPTTALTADQVKKLAYADCTAGGMMGNLCMTGMMSATGGGATMGTMGGFPLSQVITKQ